ncbi:MAG: hypothetical protein JWM33_1838 [Caulobacteraceae bacterium]|nr:hypothetical protein [Caulobacteraceae bacterium]
MDLEVALRGAVARAYAAAGLRLAERDAESLARIYAAWAGGCDQGIVDRIEQKLARSLGGQASFG